MRYLNRHNYKKLLTFRLMTFVYYCCYFYGDLEIMVWKFVALLIWGSLSIVVIIEEFKIFTLIWIEG